MDPLVSNKEYDLHFSDPSQHSDVSLFYLKLTDSSRLAIEQATRALSASRSQVSPSIKLEMGEHQSGTLTLPRVSLPSCQCLCLLLPCLLRSGRTTARPLVQTEGPASPSRSSSSRSQWSYFTPSSRTPPTRTGPTPLDRGGAPPRPPPNHRTSSSTSWVPSDTVSTSKPQRGTLSIGPSHTSDKSTKSPKIRAPSS